MLKEWDELPEFMRVPEVRPYWEKLWERRRQLVGKRFFDVVISIIFLFLLLVPMLVISIAVKLESPGPVLYRQVRVTQYGRKFRINKFRTMYEWAGNENMSNQHGLLITVADDSRITKVGAVLRKYRLDEFPQVFNVILGDMSFVGTRPEVPKYVKMYLPEYYATLLLPAGITSECSIRYKDENRLLEGLNVTDVDKVYIEQILPAKMKWDLESVRRFRLFQEILTMFRTVFAVLGKDYE